MSKTKFIVPNLFTSLNFLLGVWSVAFSAGAIGSGGSASLMTGAHLIIMCGLLDKLDGFAAKKLNASSEFGAQFDSLADLIAFGIAPAFNLFFAYKRLAPDWFASHVPLLVGALSLYVLTAAMRLAKYNAVDADAHPHYFVGLPSTFAGAINAAMMWLIIKYELFSSDMPLQIPLIVWVGSGLLMVAPLYLSKLRRQPNAFVNAFQGVNIVLAYVFGFTRLFPEYFIGISLLYFTVGFGYGLKNREQIIKEEESGFS